MAFDTKQLKTFDWLQKLGTKKVAGLKPAFNPYSDYVFVRFGRFYATNGYILASVEYPEYTHVGDEGWRVIDDYKDGKGRLLSPITFANPQVCDKMRDRIFEDTFVKSWDFIDAGPYNPRLIAECMKPFIVNDIPVSMVIAQNRVEFSGYNKDVSIRVVMMGLR